MLRYKTPKNSIPIAFNFQIPSFLLLLPLYLPQIFHMNILLLGSGGREHTLAWKIKQSAQCNQLFIAPGNAGTIACGTNVEMDILDFNVVLDFVKKQEIQLVVVGPEAPLVLGIFDFLKAALPNLIVVGPSQEAAQLEGSKAFAKKFMNEFGIPTAGYQEFTLAELELGKAYIASHPLPVVLKADGLAAGKGVLICNTTEQALVEFEHMLNGKFGHASSKVVVEEFLDGIEFSVFVITDGTDYQLLPIAKDYKKIGEGDIGLNTGGMGSVSPVPFVDEILLKKVKDSIISPTIQGIQTKGFNYRGFIFFGLINIQGNPFVIEYNCRLGDPETQTIIPRLENDVVELMIAMEKGALKELDIHINPQFAAAVILVSGGYPEKYQKGIEIQEIAESDCLIFHAGTKLENGKLKTNGGRVLAITSLSENMESAVQQSIQKAESINFEGKYYRKDIGFDLSA